jgi:hypothetical protein
VLQILRNWRINYNGVKDPETGKVHQYSLVEAAQRVGVPKKSLDDYMLVIKHAKMYGFDFEKNKNMRFGLVRAYVKSCKTSHKSKVIDCPTHKVDLEQEFHILDNLSLNDEDDSDCEEESRYNNLTTDLAQAGIPELGSPGMSGSSKKIFKL